MKHLTLTGIVQECVADVLALGVWQDGWSSDEQLIQLNEALGGKLIDILKAENFKAKEGESRIVDTLGALPAQRVLIWGLGKEEEAGLKVLRDFAHAAVCNTNQSQGSRLAVLLPSLASVDHGLALENLVFAAELGSYAFDRYLTERKDSTTQEVLWSMPGLEQDQVERAQAIARGIGRVRDLVNEPAGSCTPETLAETARELAELHGFDLEMFNKEQLLRGGFGGLSAVSAGSDREAYLIHLVYRPDGVAREKVALVGKGITFDSGGYNLKPTSGILGMKMDMAGAATVLGVFDVLGTLRPDVEVHGYVSTCENLVNGRAYKPGDVITAYTGKTIEIDNTDAEGRLVLADALGYACEQTPDAIIDMATLTGASMVALGEYTSAVFSNNDRLKDRFMSAVAETDESFWSMPLDKKLRGQLDSKIADIKNCGKRHGGAITAALFLQEFVGDTSWIHLDIAGPAYVADGLGSIPEGGTGFGVYTLIRFLEG